MNELKQAAFKWWQQGFNVVPVKIVDDKKQPLGDWGQWHSRRQTEKDFNELPWHAADGFGIVTDYPNSQGLFLAVVDYDVKRVSEEAKAKGKELLPKFPITRMDRTVTGGIHLVYLSKVKPRGNRRYHDSHALELIAGGLLAVMAPSKGYLPLNDNEPTVVEDVEGTFYQVLGVKDERAEAAEGVAFNLLEQWLSQIKAKLKVAGEGSQYIYAHCPFHLPDNHPSFALHKTKYYAIDYHDGKVYSLKQLAEALGIELEGLSEGLTCRLGAYRLNLSERNVFLLDFKGQPVFTCKLHLLNTDKNKGKIAELTGVDRGELEKRIAEFTFKAHIAQKYEERNEVAEETEPPIILDEETEARVNAEVERIVNSDNQLEALKPHLDVVIVGEDDNKQAIYTLLIGSKFADLDKKQIIILKGTEGGGKTTIASTLTGFFKTKTVGRFTEHALEYSDIKGYEVLYIKELGSMDMDKQGVASIKFLSADDKGFIVEYTIRDEEGRFRTEQKRIPAITTVSTTTRLSLDSQFERRAWLFNVDESPEQTERVLKWKARIGQQKDEIKLGLRKITDYDFSRLVIERFNKQLKPAKIVIPFRESLAQILDSNILRARGDIDKLYTFIELYGLLNLKRLQKVGEDVYIATSEIAVEALNIVDRVLANMLGSGDERIKPLINVLKELGVKAYDNIDKGLREQIAIKLGKSEGSVRLYLNHLERRGVLSSDNKKPKTYTLLYPLAEVEQKLLAKSLISKVSNVLHDNMQKEAQKWLEKRLLKPTSGERDTTEGVNNLKLNQEGNQNVENLSLLSPSRKNGFNNPEISLKQASLTETSPENRKLSKFTILRRLPEGLLECPYCKEEGQAMFFATEHDLDLHVKRKHPVKFLVPQVETEVKNVE
jgi:energy-coupling factor transporter ATP-binding protein EcfA2